MKQAKRDLIDYKAFVSRRLDIGRLKDALDEPIPTATPSTRDNDSHYFNSYDDNGKGDLALNLHPMHESAKLIPLADIHALMIQDKVRTASYASFIMTNTALFCGAVVLDVGCGTGILSLFAARAGARRVIAVDASDIAHKTRSIVKANKLDDVIT